MAQPIKIIMALDVGSKRIGVALANTISRLPSPWGVIAMDGHADKAIKQLVGQENVSTVVVGLPRNLDGQDTAQTVFVRKFAETLKQALPVPLQFQDEALTSKQAEAELHARGIRYNKEAVDALAATYILNDFLREHEEPVGNG